MSWESEAHRDWHTATGIPMGTPGCPQDACHLPEPEHCIGCGDYLDEDQAHCGEAACAVAHHEATLRWEAEALDRLAKAEAAAAAAGPWDPPF